MNFQFEVLKKVVNFKMILIIILGLFFSFLYILNNLYFAHFTNFNIENLKTSIGLFDINNFNSISLLISLFYILTTIYFTYKFYTYEVEGSFYNILLRVNSKKWFINKIIMIFIFTIILRLITILIINIFILGQVNITFPIILELLSIHLLTSIVVVTLTNFQKNILLILLTIVLIILLPSKFLLTFIFLIINILFFNIKTFVET